MKDSERQLLGHLRSALLPLHKRLLEWERKTYERSRGQRMTSGELLKVIVGDPHFAWLHPMSALIVRIDETLDTPDPDTTVTFDAIVAQVIADGHVHIYAKLRGRAVAGAKGLVGARIFVQKLEAELVAVSEGYMSAEEIPHALRGKAAQIWLEDGQCKAAPL